jgi:hypothetical protein
MVVVGWSRMLFDVRPAIRWMDTPAYLELPEWSSPGGTSNNAGWFGKRSALRSVS